MGFSVAVTHYERFELLVAAVGSVVDDERVAEIVVSDDASQDGSWERILEIWDGDEKVRLWRNERNLDCYANKAAAVRRCKSGWVVLLDSDNVLDAGYFDALEKLEPLQMGVAYLPTFARPDFDYRAFAGQIVDRTTVASHVDEPMFTTALNTANHCFHRDDYLAVWNQNADPRTVDSLYMSWRWLAAGWSLQFVAGMEYEHRMHDGSHFVHNHTHADEMRSRSIIQALRVMR